jgi:hypothetical protein
MSSAFAILSTASVAIANLMVIACLLMAGRADRKMKEFRNYRFEPENPDVIGQP